MLRVRLVFLALALSCLWTTSISGSGGGSAAAVRTITDTATRSRRGEEVAPLSLAITSDTTRREGDRAEDDNNNYNCFVHEMTSSSDFFQAGKRLTSLVALLCLASANNVYISSPFFMFYFHHILLCHSPPHSLVRMFPSLCC